MSQIRHSLVLTRLAFPTGILDNHLSLCTVLNQRNNWQRVLDCQMHKTVYLGEWWHMFEHVTSIY
jgi:hypothetical protein